MNPANADFGEARQLEDIKFNQWMSEAAIQRETDLRTSERSLAVRGLAQSGAKLKAEVDIIFGSINSVVDKAVAYRQELGAKVPALLEPGNLGPLKSKLTQFIDGGVNGVRQRAALRPRDGGAVGLMQEAERHAYSAKARLNQRLAALPLEARLGLHRAEQPKTMTTVHISNSTVANLNLGNVVGDLNGSIQQLNSGGQHELGEGFKKITEAVGSSQELDDGTRKELLEHLALVSAEAAKPAESRKIGPLKTSIEAIKTGVAVGTQLLTLWQGVENALKAAGVLH